jgi:RIO-like serine/threonine protein kinase
MKFTINNASNEFNMLKRLKNAHYVPQVRNGNFVALNGNLKVFGPTLRGAKSAFIMNKVGGMTFRNYKQMYGNKMNVNALNRRLTLALSNLRGRGISHGNLSGGNIIVSITPDGKITGAWVIDFGRAKHIPINGYNSGNFYNLHRLLGRTTNFKPEELAAKLGKRRREIANNLKLLTNSKERVGRSKRRHE